VCYGFSTISDHLQSIDTSVLRDIRRTLMNKRAGSLFLGFFLILIVLVAFGLHQSKGHGARNNLPTAVADKQAPDYSGYFTEEAPRGKWQVAAHGDENQKLIDDAPVLVDRVQSLLGNGKWMNLIVKTVGIRNNTPKPVREVKLKWILSTEEAPTLLQGYTPSFDVRIPTKDRQTGRSPNRTRSLPPYDSGRTRTTTVPPRLMNCTACTTSV
jgi:hypothetical protein